jgi:hypothetical protein
MCPHFDGLCRPQKIRNITVHRGSAGMNIQAEYLVPRIKEQLNKSTFDCHCTLVWCTNVIKVYNELPYVAAIVLLLLLISHSVDDSQVSYTCVKKNKLFK